MRKFRYQAKFSSIQHSTGRQFKIGGYRPDPDDSSDKKYGAGRYQADKLPPRVDLRPYMTKVEQQGDLNSCTANAMAGAYEYLAMRQFGTAGDVSRLFIYYNARELDGAIDLDEGTYLRSCIKTLRKYGACLENTWPYHPIRVFNPPHGQAYEEAARFLIDDAERIDVDLYAMRHCLAEGYPFAFGLQLFSSFDQAEERGMVPIPDPYNEEHHGGHAMLCVGYSDKDQMFVVRNSWGPNWGNQGYCYIPYDYMTDPELNGDCWTIRSVSDLDFSEGVWGDYSSFFDSVIPLISELLTIEDDQQIGEEEDEDVEATYDEDEEEEYDSEEDEEEYDSEDSYNEDDEKGYDESEVDDEEYDDSEEDEEEYDSEDSYNEDDEEGYDESEVDEEYDSEEEDKEYDAEEDEEE